MTTIESMAKNKKILLGFSLFLEHILPYEKMEEKARMKSAPMVHLGGGAYNIVKTLESLGVKPQALELFGITGRGIHPQRIAVEDLLKRERFSARLLATHERPSTSYYLVPEGGQTWAFGDPGGKNLPLTAADRNAVQKGAAAADIRILTEIRDDAKEINLVKLAFKKNSPNQVNVLIPAIDLLKSKKMYELIPHIDLLSLNEVEARVLFCKDPQEEDILTLSIPNVLITRGAGEAWLKAGNRIWKASPRKLKQAKFVGGAGDAATAALLYKLFIKKERPETGLRFALDIGTKTLQVPTSYY